ncbi:histidine permease, partial [Cryomyces antarcticus]
MAPTGYGALTAGERIQNFFQAYLSAPIIVLFYVVFKIVKRAKIRRTKEMDLVTGQRELNLAQLTEEDRLERMNWSAPKR